VSLFSIYRATPATIGEETEAIEEQVAPLGEQLISILATIQ
jgi:hypothetical protein